MKKEPTHPRHSSHESVGPYNVTQPADKSPIFGETAIFNALGTGIRALVRGIGNVAEAISRKNRIKATETPPPTHRS